MLNDPKYKELSQLYGLDVLRSLSEEGAYGNEEGDRPEIPILLSDPAVPLVLAEYVMRCESVYFDELMPAGDVFLRMAWDLLERCEKLEARLADFED